VKKFHITGISMYKHVGNLDLEVKISPELLSLCHRGGGGDVYRRQNHKVGRRQDLFLFGLKLHFNLRSQYKVFLWWSYVPIVGPSLKGWGSRGPWLACTTVAYFF
jgi:hypothetical protein